MPSDHRSNLHSSPQPKNYKQALGTWGENVAARLLMNAGFTDVVILNDRRQNHPGGDILANLSGQSYLFSVKARDRFMENGKVNRGYNVYPQKVIAAARTYDAEPAWLVVRADRRDNTYCAYWGRISEIPHTKSNSSRIDVSMLDAAIVSYRCLANSVVDASIPSIFAEKAPTLRHYSGKNVCIPKQSCPKAGTKARAEWDLLTRPHGATKYELDQATGWRAYSYINDTKGLAKRYGGTPRWEGEGATRRFWIERP